MPPDAPMFWAACCIAFFGFLRVGEMVAPGSKSFDCRTHLCVEDIAVDNPNCPNVVKITIK